MRDFRKLTVWRKAHQLVLGVYEITSSFPKDETYGITSQMRRAGVSVPANIAEGCGRNGEAEFVRFLQIAQGSASELEYHLLLAHDLKLLNSEEYSLIGNQIEEVKRMLTTLIRRVKDDGRQQTANNSEQKVTGEGKQLSANSYRLTAES